MKVTFLGTAGGRFSVISQLRASGGWILEMGGQRLSVDPGPGALVYAKRFGVDLRKLTGLVVSHCHPDHYTDAEYVIEAITSGATKKKGVLVASEYVVKGGGDYRAAVSPYHLKALEGVEILEPGKSARVGKLKITGIESRHSEPKCLGFVFEAGERLGYVADSEYFEGQERHYAGCDYMVINCLRPRGDDWPKHMNTEGARKLRASVKPRAAILTHFGFRMLKAGPEREAGWAGKETGVKVMAARDGVVFDTAGSKGKSGLNSFLEHQAAHETRML